ncbi:MAG: hypothetical protein KAJ07_01005 [Planctomycetes bacterium]|nr:hypothetical protein [Planctomycetota bacterium]
MQVFSKDVDILKHEGVLFSELYFPWQVLSEGGDGELNGTSFSSAGADFVNAGITAGGVIYLSASDGAIEGSFEIVSVDSSTELTVSVLRADTDDSAIDVGVASGLSYRISTFEAQSGEMMFELTRYFGVAPGDPDSDYGVSDIADVSVLKQASVYAVIASIYASAGNGNADDGYWKKSLHYRKLFEKARDSVRLGVDIDGSNAKTIGGGFGLIRE